jgi:hypothetical protein
MKQLQLKGLTLLVSRRNNFDFVFYNFYKTVDTNIPFEKFCSKDYIVI